MFFSYRLICLFAAVAVASPTAESESLFNGVANATVTVGQPSLLTARNVCSGSVRCSNSQGFKNDCTNADLNIQNTIYTSGGDRSGVCSGKCGIFVQGNYKDASGNKQTCTAQGIDLLNARQQIMNNGCQTCGWITMPNGCTIKTDYVSGC